MNKLKLALWFLTLAITIPISFLAIPLLKTNDPILQFAGIMLLAATVLMICFFSQEFGRKEKDPSSLPPVAEVRNRIVFWIAVFVLEIVTGYLGYLINILAWHANLVPAPGFDEREKT